MSEHPVGLLVSDDLQRKRLTVFFRLLLAIPHYVWFSLWGIAAIVVAFVNWLATLIAGRPPQALHRFLASYVKYATQLYAYLYLAADPYPPFDGREGYPVDVAIAPPARQSRWIVALRLLLALPAVWLAGALGVTGLEHLGTRSATSFVVGTGLLHLAAFLGWFAILARGRMPRGLRDAGAYALSYGAQLWAYLFVLTDRYPDSDPLRALGELPRRADPILLKVNEELRRSRLTVFFRLLLVLPHLVWLSLWGVAALLCAVANWLATLARGVSPRALHAFLAAYVRYAAHVYAYAYLLANPFPGFTGRADGFPVDVRIAAPVRQGRLGVLFRLLLAIPALMLAGAYGSLMFAAAVLGWFVALFTAEMPRGLRNAGTLGLRYLAQTHGYVFLLTSSYPYGGPCLPVGDVREPLLPSAASP